MCALLALSLAACGGASSKNQTQLANPYVDCATLEDAAALAGFDFSLPESLLENRPQRMIRAIEKQMIEVVYKTQAGEPELLLRKGLGEGDVSGDYNEYAQTSTLEVNGVQVTLKGDGQTVTVATWAKDGYAYALRAESGLEQAEVTGLVQAAG